MRYVGKPYTFFVLGHCIFSIFSDGPRKVYRSKFQALLSRNLNPTSKQSGGVVTIWRSTSSLVRISMEFIDRIMSIVEKNVKQSDTNFGVGK